MAAKETNSSTTLVRTSEAAAAMAALLLIIALKTSGNLSRSLIVGALAVLLLSLFIRRPFMPLVRIWHGLGEVLGRIVTPIVLSILFFVVLTPIALVHRLFKRDPLKLHRQPGSLFNRMTKTFVREDLLRPF